MSSPPTPLESTTLTSQTSFIHTTSQHTPPATRPGTSSFPKPSPGWNPSTLTHSDGHKNTFPVHGIKGEPQIGTLRLSTRCTWQGGVIMSYGTAACHT